MGQHKHNQAASSTILIQTGRISAATENGGEEVTTMFQIELLTGGVFWVYAVDTAENMFLIYRDSQWNWIGMEKCKPYYLKVSEWANKKFVSTFCSYGERREE